LLTNIREGWVNEIRNARRGLLTTISATSISVSLAQLISGGSGATPSPAAAATNSAAPSTTASSGAAAFVTLSDQAKAAAATKAESDQVAADTLQAYVEAHRVNSSGTPATTTASDTSTGSTGTQPTAGSKVEVIVAQIKALADANEPPPFQSFTPTKSLSNSVTFDGYTLSLETNASTQFYGVAVSGNGAQVFDKHFGPSDGAGGGSGVPPGVAIGTAMVDNNEAEEAITITQNTATASSASISSSSGSIATSSVSAQSSQITFLVNYATGQISVAQTAASVSAQAARVSLPGSTLSTLA
jgi:hypothetical protein